MVSFSISGPFGPIRRKCSAQVHRQVAVDEDASLAIAQRLEIGRLADAFSRSSRRFLFLDLGGTLIPKGDSVSKVLKSATKGALLRPGVRRALQALSEDPQTTGYVVLTQRLH